MQAAPIESGSATSGSLSSHSTELVTLLFTDIVDSTAIKQQLGEGAGARFIQRHHALVRETLALFPRGSEVGTAGDSFLIRFSTPSDAVEFALALQMALGGMRGEPGVRAEDRIGIHVGEVMLPGAEKPNELFGMHIDIASRVTSLARGRQILMTRTVFDNARQVLKGGGSVHERDLAWVSHGLYQFKGVEDPLEICEVSFEEGVAHPPADTDKARRCTSGTEEVLGWRPAIGQKVPGTDWVLDESLGEGGFGEVWVGTHSTLRERRVFKFCFKADRVRALKREVLLFRLLKERMGEHPHIVSIREVYFEQPPCYVEMDYTDGRDLRAWVAGQGGIGAIPLKIRLEIVAQVADALQAAHECGVIHRDVKPENILVRSVPEQAHALGVHVKLTDFGVGQVVSEELLQGLTTAGYTRALVDPKQGTSGTPIYMAPEVLAGKTASPRSDIFALGVVLYQLLVEDFSQPVPPDWEGQITDLLLRDDLQHCFAGNPGQRFAAAAQLAQRLRAWQARKDDQARAQREQQARERAAYQRGIARTALFSLVIVGLFAVLTVFAVRKARAEVAQRRLLEAKELALQRNLYVADVNVAAACVRDDNLGRALSLLKAHQPEPGALDLRDWEWHYLHWQCRSHETATVCERPEGVQALHVLSNGQLLLRQFSGDVVIWDSEKNRITRQRAASGWGKAVAVAPSGLIAVGSGAGTVIWDPDADREVANFPGEGPMASVAFGRDGELLAHYGGRGVVRAWELESGRLLREFKAAAPVATHHGVVTFSPDGSLLATGEMNHRVRVFRLSDGTLAADLKHADQNPGDGITALSFSPDGSLLAAGSGFAGNSVCVWELPGGRLAATFKGHRGWVSSLAFSPDGHYLISGGADQKIRWWDLRAMIPAGEMQGHMNEVWALAFAPDGSALFSGGKDHLVKAWPSTPEPALPHAAILEASSVAISSLDDRGRLAVAERNGRVTVRDVATGQEFCQWTNNAARINCLALSPDGARLAIGRTDGLEVVAVPSGERQWGASREDSGAIGLMEIDREGRTLFAAGSTEAGSRIVWWDISSGERLRFFEGKFSATDVRLSPDGTRVAVLDYGGRVRLLHAVTGAEEAGFETQPRSVSVCFSPSGALLAVASQDGVARVVAMDGSPKALFKIHRFGMHAAVFLSENRLITGSRELHLWDVATEREVAVLEGFAGPVSSIEVRPRGQWIVARGTDGSVRYWRSGASGMDAAKLSGVSSK